MKLKELIHEQIKNNIKRKYDNIFLEDQKKHINHLMNERAVLKIESLQYENQVLKSYGIDQQQSKSININETKIIDEKVNAKISDIEKQIEDIVSSITKNKFKINALWSEANFRKEIHGVLSMEELYGEVDDD